MHRVSRATPERRTTSKTKWHRFLDGSAAIAASKTPDVQLDKADMEAAALAVVDRIRFHLSLPPVCKSLLFPYRQSAMMLPGISTWHMVLYIQPINFNGSVGTCNITINVVPMRGCKYDFEAVTMVTAGCHGILLVPNLLL